MRACEGWSASSVSRHGNRIPFGVTQYWDGNEEARIRPRVFCFTMRAAQVAVAGVGRGWREAEWSGGTYATKRWSTARAITTFLPPPPRPAIVIRVVSCIRIVRSINHRAKRSGDFLTPFPSRREGRDRRRRRITFPDRNDDCTRLRKRSNSFVVVVVVVVRNC